MIIYFHKYYPDNIMEICISEYISPETINDAIDETGVYDFVIVYDLFSEEENAKIYAVNINILINNKSKDNLYLLLNNNEVIMGDKFAKKNYAYYPLGEKHITKFGEYKINGIVFNCSDIYYSDLSILKNSNIKNQSELMKRYKDVKYDFYFKQFVFQTNNMKEIKNIAVFCLLFQLCF